MDIKNANEADISGILKHINISLERHANRISLLERLLMDMSAKNHQLLQRHFDDVGHNEEIILKKYGIL